LKEMVIAIRQQLETKTVPLNTMFHKLVS
jgi:hypothetical protein